MGEAEEERLGGCKGGGNKDSDGLEEESRNKLLQFNGGVKLGRGMRPGGLAMCSFSFVYYIMYLLVFRINLHASIEVKTKKKPKRLVQNAKYFVWAR